MVSVLGFTANTNMGDRADLVVGRSKLAALDLPPNNIVTRLLAQVAADAEQIRQPPHATNFHKLSSDVPAVLGEAQA